MFSSVGKGAGRKPLEGNARTQVFQEDQSFASHLVLFSLIYPDYLLDPLMMVGEHNKEKVLVFVFIITSFLS